MTSAPEPVAKEPGSVEPAAEPIHDERPEVGLGPWEGMWPQEEHYDPELLAEGDRRNVLDKYRYWKMDAIIAELDTRRHEFHIAIENWQHDMNIGTVVRTANAFLAKEVHIIGRRRWNRRGAMVTDRYQHVRHHATVEEFTAWAHAEGLAIIGIDIFPDSQQLETYELPRKCVLVFGQEGPGLSAEVHAAAEATLSIEQFGSTRSINAASAAGIAMHAWIRRHVFNQRVR
ncbi:tRNA G18 (ribose-2'-O)-methylase SpoU [Paeniglutamicibacter cryotolerans]|uniref:tRNA G18 (Ribose-2'-O)-methylase SpoU n=2 Tax=Paeniglutamicibacter cryotolerans TaxID=670079 RepID=A0A839QM82_9MICC|nr:tRNA G18 (ribose-2'-O)-methylase SpoU [Paeniglutamicibacter cryotolerans]